MKEQTNFQKQKKLICTKVSSKKWNNQANNKKKSEMGVTSINKYCHSHMNIIPIKYLNRNIYRVRKACTKDLII